VATRGNRARGVSDESMKPSPYLWTYRHDVRLCSAAAGIAGWPDRRRRGREWGRASWPGRERWSVADVLDLIVIRPKPAALDELLELLLGLEVQQPEVHHAG
jgi:hypothetical protein